MKISTINKTIWRWCTQHQLIIFTKWWFILYDLFSVFTGFGKYHENYKTDKYKITIKCNVNLLNIHEHNHLQNTVFKLLHIYIQEQHDINMI
jgi:hypothetical protein